MRERWEYLGLGSTTLYPCALLHNWEKRYIHLVRYASPLNETWMLVVDSVATFVHNGFDETLRLGLQSETEQLFRHASPLNETGMLVVDSVVSDVLVRMNGEVITQFLKMETILDDGVGQNVKLEFERGGVRMTVVQLVEFRLRLADYVELFLCAIS
ncbi:protease Do-like protein 7 isoform X2 [Tanacetum coccineum]